MRTKRLRLIVFALAGLILLLDVAPVSGIQSLNPQKVDDWQYNGSISSADNQLINSVAHLPLDTVMSFAAGRPLDAIGSSGALSLTVPFGFVALTQSHLVSFFGITNTMAQATGGGVPEAATGDIGFAAGGAKDINNFRDNINQSYLPIPTDITYEGLFYDYYFDTGQQEACEQLFCPSYSRAVTEDPLSGEEEQYMTVGLNSNLDQDMFERKKLNMVLVLDMSGSMSSSFDKYYYDRFGNKHQVEEHSGKSKITVAAESLAALTTHLEPGDRLGVVLFNNNAMTAKPLRLTEKTDMAAIRDHMLELQAGGGTNMEAGMEKATKMLQEYVDVDRTEYENRIVFLTDAMPNLGTTRAEGENSLLSMMDENARDGVYTTFVGIGVDFQTKLVDEITAVEGANYFSVHSSNQFKQRMDDQFEYMVTPLVFNLSLRVDTDDIRIEKVYGSTAAEESTGQIMKVNTLFPSPTEDGETRGGVVLLKINGTASDVGLEASYTSRDGEKHTTTRTVSFDQYESEYFANTGVRKAVLLSRYADLMKNWIVYERSQVEESTPEIQPAVDVASKEGIEPPHPSYSLGQWERQSVQLRVSEMYEQKISTFRDYFQNEADAIGDDALDQEGVLMDRILAAAQ